MSFHDNLCRREFFDLAALCPVAPSLLSCPLLLPFVPLVCGELTASFAGDAPFAADKASREYWFRPRRPLDFCGGRPPRRGAGAGFNVSMGASGGADAEADAETGITGSSVGVGVASETSGSSLLSVRQNTCTHDLNIPSAFLRSARPLRLLAASLRSCSRSFSRCSFSR